MHFKIPQKRACNWRVVRLSSSAETFDRCRRRPRVRLLFFLAVKAMHASPFPNESVKSRTRGRTTLLSLVVQQLFGLYLSVEIFHVLFRPRTGERDFGEADGATATEGGMEAAVRKVVATDILHVLDALGVCAIFTCHSAFPLEQAYSCSWLEGVARKRCAYRGETSFRCRRESAGDAHQQITAEIWS